MHITLLFWQDFQEMHSWSMYLYYHHHIHAVSRMTLFLKNDGNWNKKKLCKSILVSIRNEWQVHHKFYHISILLFVSTFCILELYWNVKLLLSIRFFSDFFILQKSRLKLFCPSFVCFYDGIKVNDMQLLDSD